MNPHDPRDRGRLFKAVKHHFKQTECFRRDRVSLIRDYAGQEFGESAPNLKTLVNLIKQTADAYTLALAYNRPKFIVTAKNQDFDAFAATFQTGVDNLIQEIHLQETLKSVVLDAFFGPGIVKTYLADAPLVEVEEDQWMDPGRPFIERISLDDFVFDTEASNFRKVRFAGDRYRIPMRLLNDTERFDQEVASKLKPSSKQSYAENSDIAKEIAYGNRTDEGEFEPMIDLMDIYIPADGIIVTWAVDREFNGIDTDPLAVQEWTGPEGGPYDMLNLGEVPDNIMPTTPASNLSALSDLLNSLLWKQKLQAERQKQYTLYRGDASKEAKHIKNAVDGGFYKSEDPSAFNQLKTDGVDQVSVVFSQGLLSMFDRMAGNLQAQAGLGAQTGTVGQDAQILGQVTRGEERLRNQTNEFVVRIGRNLGALMYDDPVLEMEGRREIEGMPGFFVTDNWTPDNRQGEFSIYDFDVEPWSMAYKSAEAQAVGLSQTVNELAPLMPIMQQQGIEFDIPEYIRQMASLRGQPKLTRIFRTAAPVPGQASTEEGGMPPNTTRTTIRKNVPTGGTPESRNQVLAQQLLGGNSAANQDSQAAFSRG